MRDCFNNRLLLKLNDVEEEGYKHYRHDNVKKYHFLLNFLLILYSLSNLIIQLNINGKDRQDHLQVTVMISYLETGIRIFSAIMPYIISNNNFRRICNYFNYLLIAFVSLSMEVSLCNNEHSHTHLLILIIVTENILRLIMLIGGMVDFLDGVVIHLLSIIVYTIGFNYLKNPDVFNITYGWVYNLVYNSIIAYLFIYFSKQSYFFNYIFIEKTKWFGNILENMNSGFIHVKNKRIEYANKMICEILQRTKFCQSLLSEHDIEDLINLTNRSEKFIKFFHKNSKKILDEFFSEINLENQKKVTVLTTGRNYTNVSDNEDANIGSENPSAFALNIFRTKYGVTDKFIYIGTKTLKILNEEKKEEEIIFEIFCKYHSSFETVNGKGKYIDDFELVFNDVSRVKASQEKKFRTLFLSKVAHEFKNPIICIIELVNRICDSYRNWKTMVGQNPNDEIILEKNIIENLNQIASLSSYILILNKDFDYFSKKELQNRELIIENDECHLEDILDFSKAIGECLLKRSNRDNNIRFEIIKNTNINSIHTDEQKLKQILVNLISNAIKFTTHGTVKLIIDHIDNEINFTVEDSGNGIKEDEKKYLFQPFANITKSKFIDNSTGTGLGMSIVYDLTKAIGKTIQFKSTVGLGSSFWFSIPLSREKSHSFKEKNIKHLSINTPVNPEVRVSSRRLTDKLHQFSNFKKIFDKFNTGSKVEVKENYPSNTTSSMSIEDNKSNSSIHSKETVKVDNLYITIKKEDKLIKNSRNSMVLKNPEVKSSTVSIVSQQTNKMPTIQMHLENYLQMATNSGMHIIVVDDEEWSRSATTRIIKNVANSKNVSVNIYEAIDGVECLYLVFLLMQKGIRIEWILSDQTMPFISGTNCANILKNYANLYYNIPFFIITAFEDEDTLKIMKGSSVDYIFSKPMKRNIAEKMFEFNSN